MDLFSSNPNFGSDTRFLAHLDTALGKMMVDDHPGTSLALRVHRSFSPN